MDTTCPSAPGVHDPGTVRKSERSSVETNGYYASMQKKYERAPPGTVRKLAAEAMSLLVRDKVSTQREAAAELKSMKRQSVV